MRTIVVLLGTLLVASFGASARADDGGEACVPLGGRCDIGDAGAGCCAGSCMPGGGNGGLFGVCSAESLGGDDYVDEDAAPACEPLGSSCGGESGTLKTCCAGSCVGGVCATAEDAGSDRACLAEGARCEGPDGSVPACCSGSCSGGVCTSGSSHANSGCTAHGTDERTGLLDLSAFALAWVVAGTALRRRRRRNTAP